MKKNNTSWAKSLLYMQKRFSTNNNNKKYYQVRDHCHYTVKYRGAAHYFYNLRNKTPKEIPVVFHNGSRNDYNSIIKVLAEECKGKFECLGENKQNYLTFWVPTKKEIDNGKKITYKTKFIESFRFISSLTLITNQLKIIKKITQQKRFL